MVGSIDEWIDEATIADLQTAMETGEVTAEKLVQAYLRRIEKYDARINSIIELNPDAVEQARQLDAERQEQGSRGLLHGIPILLKDNLDTADRMHTSAGSIALANSYAAEDSFVAKQLRAAGAILLGKTNMTEWANFMANDMPSGYSSRGGQVLNPYGPGTIDVGGSSSGSGAAIAANLAAAAVGTETSGSIVNPACQNSIVGIKPTVGLISRSGVIPIAHSQDTPGPMARTVADAAILLGALTETDERDEATMHRKGSVHTDYTPFLDPTFLKSARIGIPRAFYKDLEPENAALMESAIHILRETGAEIVDPVSLPCEEIEWNINVLRYEFKPDLNSYLAKLSPHVPVHSLAELIRYNEEHADIALKYGQHMLQWSEETSGTLTESEYISSRSDDLEWSRNRGIDAVLQEHQLDALMFPHDEGHWIAARAGYPLIAVPAGFTSKGPMGITLSGTAFSEPTLIRIAYGFEQATKYRRPPRLD